MTLLETRSPLTRATSKAGSRRRELGGRAVNSATLPPVVYLQE